MRRLLYSGSGCSVLHSQQLYEASANACSVGEGLTRDRKKGGSFAFTSDPLCALTIWESTPIYNN